jgi:CheY-like chemotaxis protein
MWNGLARSKIELQGIRILVVDDEANAREVINEILTSCGAEVFAVISSKEALEIIPSFH